MTDPVTTVSTAVASSVISSVLTNLATRALNELDFSGGIDSIKFKLGAAESYLKNVSQLEKYKVREIERVTYCAAEAIEKLLWLRNQQRQESSCVGYLPRYCHYLLESRITLCKINREFKRLSNIIPSIFEFNSRENTSTAHQPEDQLHEDPRKRLYNIDIHEVVGFDGLTQDILEECSSNYQNLAVVSIWGMGGTGKSTLAKKVFDKADGNHFPIKVWITISQQYDVLNLKKKILQNIIKISDETLGKKTDNEVSDKLYEYLGERRYLIVLDDIWEPQSWDDIYFLQRESHDYNNSPNSLFPDKNNASRIILTTRKFDVANKPNIKTFLHEMEPLGDEEGWKLLKEKAFPSYVTVSELLKESLETLGPEITKKCEGLPLALVVLGGYLSKHHDYKTWEKMAKDVDWKEAGDQVDISKILALSYDDLPNDLKPIFLYITTFPEDHIIRSSDLIKLWIAEGFIPPPRGNYRLEKTARFYLDQLYERGLVQVMKWSRAHERISRIRIHDVLRDWGIERAEQDGFFKVISNSDNATPFGDAHTPYRVAFHNHWDDNLDTSMPHVRTMFGFNILPKHETFFRGLKSLLVVSFIRGSMSDLIFNTQFLKHMIFLRYICLRNYGTIYLPSSIGQLCNLQTLDCRASWISSFPSSLWEIPTLRHVYLDSMGCEWRGPKKGLGKNLQTLVISSRMVPDSAWNGTVEAVQEMKEIVYLNLGFEREAVVGIPSNTLYKIRSLCSLEVLKIGYMEALTRIPGGIFPLSLVKIVLNCSGLEDDPMPVFWELPKLVVLKLYSNIHLKSIHCNAVGGFPRLKYLKLANFEKLEEWKVDNGAMPNLCHVWLQECINLRSFPEKLMDHSQLELLELLFMPQLCSVDFRKLEEKELNCKVILTEDGDDSRLSGRSYIRGWMWQ